MTQQHERKGRSPLIRLVDTVGSIPFGLTLLVLILIYCWIGSAGLAPVRPVFVRQYFEKTEMEWFTWWPFQLLMVLFCIALILVTLRRVPLTVPKIGVWIVHLGVLVLCLGCWIYFGHKYEGSMAVYRRTATFQAGNAPPASIVLQPDASVEVPAPNGHYHVSVVDLNPHYNLLTGDDKGKTAYAAQLLVEPALDGGENAPFIRQVIAGYPEYTEDVIPGKGRTVKILGKKTVDENLAVTLDYAAVDRMTLRDHPALHARLVSRDDWTEYPLRGLPRYSEHVAAGEATWYDAGEKPVSDPLDIEPRPGHGENAGGIPDDVSFRVTGYLPFATLQEAWEPGGDEMNPYILFSAEIGNSAETDELLAFQQPRATLFDGLFDATFRWIDDPAELEALRAPVIPTLLVSIPSKRIRKEIPLSDVHAREVEVGGYGLRLEQLFPNWSLAGASRKGEPASMGLVAVRGPDRTFRRAVVAPDADLSQDLDEEGMRHQELLDDRIHLELHNVTDGGLTFVAGPDGLHALLRSQDGQVEAQDVEVGERVDMLDGHLHLTIHDYCENARGVMRPAVIPRRERDNKAGDAFSMIQVQASSGDWTQSTWLEFSPYNYPTRVGYHPYRMQLPDGRWAELLYSDETHPLPAAVALEEFQLETYPGEARERDYISLVRFRDNGKWSDVQEVRSNNPVEHDGWWYFQSTWDPPAPEMNYAGLNYTGLGVGNRKGVGIMLLGCFLVVLGTIYSFYVKPVILRRRARGFTRTSPPPPAVPAAARESETVST